MMIFILQDIIVSVAVSFTIALYVGSFVQRRRDVKEMEERSNMEAILKKLLKELLNKPKKKEI